MLSNNNEWFLFEHRFCLPVCPSSSTSFTGLEAFFFFFPFAYSLIKVIREVREWTVKNVRHAELQQL
jgi:hypothetical protein